MKTAKPARAALLVIHALALALLALAFCWMYRAPVPVQARIPPRADDADAFERYRAERTQTRAAHRAALMRLSDDPDVGAEAKKRLLDLCAQTEKETALEGALALKGFSSPIAYVGADLVNIFLRSGQLLPEESARVLSLAIEITGQPARNIRIVPTGIYAARSGNDAR